MQCRLQYIKAIDIWLSFCMVLVFAAVLEYAIANYLHRQSDGLLARNSQRFNQIKFSSLCTSRYCIIPFYYITVILDLNYEKEIFEIENLK